jgi:hypothetical protein
MWTKQALVLAARRELGLGGAFDVNDADELLDDLQRLDAMVAAWASKGIRLSYALPSSPGASNINAASGIADAAAEAVYLGLAMRIAPGYGKVITPETRTAARNAYDALLIDAAQPQQQQLRGGMPAGAGHKPNVFHAVFLPEPDTSPLREGVGESLDILPE